jgi:hypothetical protein
VAQVKQNSCSITRLSLCFYWKRKGWGSGHTNWLLLSTCCKGRTSGWSGLQWKQVIMLTFLCIRVGCTILAFDHLLLFSLQELRRKTDLYQQHVIYLQAHNERIHASMACTVQGVAKYRYYHSVPIHHFVVLKFVNSKNIQTLAHLHNASRLETQTLAEIPKKNQLNRYSSCWDEPY